MRAALATILVFSLLSIRPTTARAAGPLGHVLLAQKTIEYIRAKKYEAPPELRAALEDAECRSAYQGGAVGPDIAEKMGHYGNTGDVAKKMMDMAHGDMESARFRKDVAAFRQAQQELAFAYGWLNHCGTDLAIHPKINETTGDAFIHNNKGEKLTHGILETQFTAYLRTQPGLEHPVYDVNYQLKFFSAVTGLSEAELRRGAAIVNGKAAAELKGSSQVTLSRDQLSSIWSGTTRSCVKYITQFTKDSTSMKNWDLDCGGEMTTEEFESLRNEVMSLNGGALPKDWGKSYLKWWALLKGLSPEERRRRLAELLGKPAPSAPVRVSVPGLRPRISGPMYLSVRLNGPYQEIRLPNVMRARPQPEPDPVAVSGSRFSFRGSGDVGGMKADWDITGEFSPTQSMISSMKIKCRLDYGRGFVIVHSAELRDIPQYLGSDIAVIYEGDVTYAIRSAQDAASHVVRFEETEERTGAAPKSATGLKFGPNSRGAAIRVVFRSTKMPIPF